MQCASKVRYPSKGNARDVARRQRAQTGVKLFVYSCSDCNGYHLTKMQPTLYRARHRVD